MATARFVIAPLAALILVGLAACAPRPGIETLNATLWMQSSVEYRMAARQAFRAAEVMMHEALADPEWTAAVEQTGDFAQLPPAIILDIDETVLDNAPFQARLAADGATFSPAAWDDWVTLAKAEAVPGALDLVGDAAKNGVAVFYVTNRSANQEAATRRNLEALGFPLDARPDALLMRGERPGWGSDKSGRRALLAADYRILLLVGDDLNDFMSGVRGPEATPEARLALAETYKDFWGRKWFVVPNPVYGSWERALFGADSALGWDAVVAHKYQALAPY